MELQDKFSKDIDEMVELFDTSKSIDERAKILISMIQYINENLPPILELNSDEWNLHAIKMYEQTRCFSVEIGSPLYKNDAPDSEITKQTLLQEIGKARLMIINCLIKNKFYDNPICPPHYSNKLRVSHWNEFMYSKNKY